jgi:hypothetical protein
MILIKGTLGETKVKPRVYGGSEAIRMESMMIGGVVEDDGKLVQDFLVGSEKTTSKDSLKCLPMNIALSRMDDSGKYLMDLGRDSSSSYDFELEDVLSLDCCTRTWNICCS